MIMGMNVILRGLEYRHCMAILTFEEGLQITRLSLFIYPHTKCTKTDTRYFFYLIIILIISYI